MLLMDKLNLGPPCSLNKIGICWLQRKIINYEKQQAIRQLISF